MAFSIEERIEAFLMEWKIRESLMLLNGMDEEIALHRKDILHNYQLTEEDIKKFQENSDDKGNE